MPQHTTHQLVPLLVLLLSPQHACAFPTHRMDTRGAALPENRPHTLLAALQLQGQLWHACLSWSGMQQPAARGCKRWLQKGGQNKDSRQQRRHAEMTAHSLLPLCWHPGMHQSNWEVACNGHTSLPYTHMHIASKQAAHTHTLPHTRQSLTGHTPCAHMHAHTPAQSGLCWSSESQI
jgi:hypothetical protein